MNKFALLALITLLAGCSSCGSSSSQGNGDTTTPDRKAEINWTERCHDYAKQCGGFGEIDPGDFGECLNDCGGDNPTGSELCTFVYCGVETAQCDNDEEGDASIVACMKERGWPTR